MNIVVFGSGIIGEIKAFLRSTTADSPPLSTIQTAVFKDEFSGCEALIVGGSRGLGAVTAKILAAGGAKVIFTYQRGAREAEAIVEEVTELYGADVCRAVKFDACGDISTQLSSLPVSINHLSFFATPQIFRQKAEIYSHELFCEFANVYLNAFENLCRFLLSRSERRPISVFYPSSVAIEERPRGITEYAMAKVAGEVLCADLQAAEPSLKISIARLPRTQTDQTTTVSPTESHDPVSIMLPLLRRMFGLH